MNQTEADRFRSRISDQIFEALARSAELREILVYKGARVLNRRLGIDRQSLDIDSNLRQSFHEDHEDREQQRRILEAALTVAIRSYFEKQASVTLELTRVKVTRRPAQDHPLGWDAFEVRVSLRDLTGITSSPPALKIDVAAPENLLDESVAPLAVGHAEVLAYTVERIAGEKLRAFLSSLPAYRKKVEKPGEAVRAKDLYDLARIVRRYAVEDGSFWKQVGREFRRACQSRFIDCEGLATFRENWDVTRRTYVDSATIPDDVSFDEAEQVLDRIVDYLTSQAVIPFAFPLPEKAASKS